MCIASLAVTAVPRRCTPCCGCSLGCRAMMPWLPCNFELAGTNGLWPGALLAMFRVKAWSVFFLDWKGSGDILARVCVCIASLAASAVLRRCTPCCGCSLGCQAMMRGAPCNFESAGTNGLWQDCGRSVSFWFGSMRFCRNESWSPV